MISSIVAATKIKIYFLEKLNREAAKVGGKIVTMNANHKIMNVDGDFRFISKTLLDEFRVWADWGRVAALRREGPISSRFLANNLTIVAGESVFVNGWLLPNHVDYGLDRINEEVMDWISGLKESVSKKLITGRNSVVWLRKLSHELAQHCDCSTLEHFLATIPGAKRID
ncbi:hypothetical protein ACSBR1_009442 [Camellia fascicularis]